MQFDNTTKSNRQHDCKNSPVLVESAGAQTAPGRKAGGVVLSVSRPRPTLRAGHSSPSSPTTRGGEVLAYSIREAARLLSVSVSTLRRLIADGSLKNKRIGGRVLVTRDALDAFLGSN